MTRKKSSIAANGPDMGHHPIEDLFKTPADKKLVRETLASNAEFRDLADNVLSLQRDVFKRFLDPRRDYEAECGYVNISELTCDDYKVMYDEESIATRVVEVYPKECWKVQPIVFEVEDEDKETEFERRRKEISQLLRGQSWFKKEVGDPIWEVCKRADIESGIGHYGAILLGIGDGKPLHEPAYEIDTKTGKKLDGSVKPLDLSSPRNPRDEFPFGTGFEIIPGMSRYSPYVGFNDQLPGRQGHAIPYGDANNLSTGPSIAPPPVPDSAVPSVTDDPPQQNYTELLFMRVFNETNCKIVEVDQDETSVRYCQPTMYEVSLNKPDQGRVGPTTGFTSKKVHWTRIVHITEGELFHTPRMRPVFHKLQNLKKLYGGSAEMYWRGAFPGLSIETHPSLGPSPKIDETKLRDSVWKYQNSLQRLLALVGMSAKSLAPQVVDPTNQIDVQITAICIYLGVPKRLFMGSERGELSSDQDNDTGDERVRERQINYLIPNVVVRLHDRFILLEVLPEPGEDGYDAEWPDQKSLGEMENAQVAVYRTEAMSKYVAGSVDQLMAPRDYLTRILKFTTEEVDEILDSTTEYLEEQNPDAETDIIPGRDPTPSLDDALKDPKLNPALLKVPPEGNGRKPPPIPIGRG